MTGILKDFNFAIAYLDNIIIFSKTTEEHLDYIKQLFKKLRSVHLSMKLSKCHIFYKGNPVFRSYTKHKGDKATTIQNTSNSECAST